MKPSSADPSAIKLVASEVETQAGLSSLAVARSNVIFDLHQIEDVMERPPSPPKLSRDPVPKPKETPRAPGKRTDFDPIQLAASIAKIAASYQASSELSNRHFLGVPKAPAFRLVAADFLARARLQKPEQPTATASAFADWIYSLYGRPGSPEDLERGRAAEAQVFEERPRSLAARSILIACDQQHLARYRPSWELVHCGLNVDTSNVPRPFFEAPDLSVDGRALGASPDLLYRNRENGEVIIVEVKLSRQPLPSNLWPNVWAQLWCYANLPLVLNAPRVTVIGEIWGELHKWSSSHNAPLHWVGLRASVRRDPRSPAYDRFFRSLFEIYRS
jgi:hypothetical protein